MAKFVKGQIANPLGSGAHNPLRREFKNLTEEQLREVFGLILSTKPSEIQEEVSKNPTVLKTWIAAAAIQGIKDGNIGPLMMIIDRILGKPKERMEISQDNKLPMVVILPPKNEK